GIAPALDGPVQVQLHRHERRVGLFEQHVVTRALAAERLKLKGVVVVGELEAGLAEARADPVEFVGHAAVAVERGAFFGVERGHDEVAVAEDVGRLDLRVEILAEGAEADVGGGRREADPVEHGADRARVAPEVTGELDLLVARPPHRLQHADEVLGEEVADGVELDAEAVGHDGRGSGAAGHRPQRGKTAEDAAGGAEKGAAFHSRMESVEGTERMEGPSMPPSTPSAPSSPSTLKTRGVPSPAGTRGGGSARRPARSGWT